MRNGFVSERLAGEEGAMSSAPDVSVVVPVHNEVESLPHLLEAISSTLIESN
ncbi:MAG: glycosyltransferase, partial [Rivularia sp. (in: cyanobacteria)]